MPLSIVMPTDAAIVRWLRRPGDPVASGDLLLEIETDKTVLEITAEQDGALGEIVHGDGTRNLPAGEVIGTLRLPADAPVETASTPAAVPTGASPSRPHDAATRNGARRGDRIFASPLARKLAATHGLALATLAGSGPGGRIVERDIHAALTLRARPALPTLPADTGDALAVALTPMRRTIAQRLTEAKLTVPHFYLSATVLLDPLLALRESLNRSFPAGADGLPTVRLSINDFIVKALALALQQVPAANTVWDGDRLLRHAASHVSVAVAVEGGLFTPVVRHADRKSLAEIAHEVRGLAARAAAHQLLPAEYQGGTSTVSNLGMYGVESFAGIVNPPQSSLLAIGQAGEHVVAREGRPAVVQALSVTLSCDHRVIDGAVGAQLLAAFKGLMERPQALRARSTRPA